jgi:hypothetical protein
MRVMGAEHTLAAGVRPRVCPRPDRAPGRPRVATPDGSWQNGSPDQAMGEQSHKSKDGPDGRLVVADERLLKSDVRATYVAHRRDGEWFVGAAGFFDRPADQFRRVPLSGLLAADASLAELDDLGVGWHAFRSGPDDPWWSHEIPRGQMFLLTYEARATSLVENRDGIGGAFVSCWVVSEAIETARERARKHLDQTGWAIVADVGEQVIAPDRIADASRAYYRQAEVDGEVYVIHAFPPEEADA